MIDAVTFLKEILEIPSPSGNEGEIALFLSKRLEEWGYQAEVDRAGNVVAELGEGKPVLLLASHLDTVPGYFPVREEDGKIFGRGAVDAKASVAAMAIAGAEAARSGIKGKIVFAGVVEEETSLKGIQTLLEELPSIDYAIFGEPTGRSRVCLASKGRLLLKIDLQTTESGHVACSWRYKNAIEEAFNLWTLLKKELSKEGGSYFSSTTPNLTVIQGGSAPNITPERCSFYVDVRFPPGVSSAQLLKASCDVVEAFRKSSGLKVDYSVLSQIEGFRTSKRTLLVEALVRAIKEELGEETKFIKKTGTCFMNLIGKHFNVPVVCYGPGDPALEHSQEESIDTEEYLAAIRVLTRAVCYVLSH